MRQRSAAIRCYRRSADFSTRDQPEVNVAARHLAVLLPYRIRHPSLHQRWRPLAGGSGESRDEAMVGRTGGPGRVKAVPAAALFDLARLRQGRAQDSKPPEPTSRASFRSVGKPRRVAGEGRGQPMRERGRRRRWPGRPEVHMVAPPRVSVFSSGRMASTNAHRPPYLRGPVKDSGPPQSGILLAQITRPTHVHFRTHPPAQDLELGAGVGDPAARS
jgi:hypothetical protein